VPDRRMNGAAVQAEWIFGSYPSRPAIILADLVQDVSRQSSHDRRWRKASKNVGFIRIVP
jgi:hypothetical protein